MDLDVIENYGIRLSRLTADKLEMVRIWRNDPKISQYMIYQKEITPEMQRKWFESVDNEYNLYYIISFKGEDIGVINVKDVDKDYVSGEGGCYIYEDKYLNSDISYRAHICLFDYLFEHTKLQKLTSEVMDFNKRSIRFTIFLGYKEVMVENGIHKFELTKEDYLNNTNRARFIKKENIINNYEQFRKVQ